MKKKAVAKLVLQRETLRALVDIEDTRLKEAQGGDYTLVQGTTCHTCKDK